MSNFAIEIKKDRSVIAEWMVSITHNGYQWTGVYLTLEEMGKLSDALLNHIAAAKTINETED